MADNKRDIELRIAATTSGSDAIKKLGSDLDALAKEAGGGSNEFDKLATSIREIGEQGDALQALNAIEATVSDTTAKFEAAGASVKELGDQLAQQRTKVDEFKTAQATAASAVDATAKRLRETKAELNSYRADSDGATRATIGYKERVQELRAEVARLQNVLSEQRAAFRQSRDATNEQNDALGKLETSYSAAEKALKRTQAELDKQNSALDKSKAALNELGIEASTVDDALTQVEQSFRGAATAAEKLESKVRELRTEQEEHDRLARLQIRTQYELARAAEIALDAERRGYAESAAVVAKYESEQKKTAASIAAVGDASKRTGREIADAFGTIGVRSATAIRQEIEEVNKALLRLATDSKISGADFDRAFVGAQARVKSLEDELRRMPGAIDESTKATNFLTSGFKQLVATYVGIDLATKFVDANVQLETLRRSLALVTGSTEQAARQISLLRSAANNAGIAVGDISESFVKFQASLNGAKVPLGTIEGLFQAVVNASGQLGLSSQKTGLILDALAQTANKGVVSMEELRQQLGDSLPGALDLTAKGLGITTAQLVKLTENGQLLSADFLPALQKSLVATFGDGEKAVEGLGASINRFKNTFTAISQAIGDSGVGRALAGTFNVAAETAKLLTFQVERIALGFEFFGKRAAAVSSGIVNGDLAGIEKALQRLENEREDKLTKLVGTLEGINTAGIDAAKSMNGAANATTAAGNAAQTAAGKQQQLADATGKGATAADAQSSSWARLTTLYGDAVARIQSNITAAEKLAAAKKIEGEAREKVAKLTGDEGAALEASAKAADQEATALATVAQRRQNEVSLLQSEIRELERLKKELGDQSGARQEAINKLKESVEVRAAETEKAKQQAEAVRFEAEQRALAVETYRDNSAAVDTLRKAHEDMRVVLEFATQQYRNGAISLDELRKVEELAARTAAKYKDAVDDVSAANERRVKSAQTVLSITEAQIDLERTRIQNEITVAQVMGDTSKALDRQIALKELDIKLLRAKIALVDEEIRLERESIQRKIEALDKNDALYKQKLADLELSGKALELKEIENKVRLESIRGILAEIEALRKRDTESKNGANGIVSDRKREKDAYDKTRQSVDALTASERRRYDQQNFALNTEGQRITAGGDTWMSVYNQLKGYGLSDAKARQLAAEFAPDGKVPYTASQAQLRYGGKYGTLSYAVQQAAQEAIRLGDTGDNQMSTPSASTPAAETAKTYTVNVNLGGRANSINTASQADADALVNLLRSLESSAGAAGPGG